MEVSQLFLGSVIYSEQARVLNRAEDWDDYKEWKSGPEGKEDYPWKQLPK